MYRSNISCTGLAQQLQQLPKDPNQPIVVLTHAKPDGDAIGSLRGFMAIMQYHQRPVKGYLLGPLVANLHSWMEGDAIQLLTPGVVLPSNPSAVVLVDTGSYSQVDARTGWVQPWLEQWYDRTVIIDHHTSGDVNAKWKWIEPDTGACSEMILRLSEDMHTSLLDSNIQDHHLRPAREALYLGLATDTGWFRFSNTSASLLEYAARLMRCGVDGSELYIMTEHVDRKERLALQAYAYQNVEWLQGTRAAFIALPIHVFTDTKASYPEAEGILDAFRRVAGNKVAIMLSETEDINGKRHVRMSLRSNPGAGAVDVAAIARRFNGGGHQRAAGARPEGSLSQVISQVRDLLDTI